MKEKVLKTIIENKLIESGDKIVLGVSGGPDSISMLSILNDIRNDKNIKLDFEINVAHINHMIRKEAKEDEEYVKQFCRKLNIKVYSKSIDVKKIAYNNKAGLEETGREVRYNFFEKVLKETNFNKIGIAHNKNDKVETVIMNVIRGSGISGLRGIEPIKNNKYIRPIIECERIEIEKYCDEKKLNPKIDKTNFENEYTRNKIRNIVIPYIKKEFNPNILEAIIKLSQLIKEEDEYLNKQVEEKYKNILIEQKEKEIIIDLKKFNQEEKTIASRIIINIIIKLFGNSKGIEKVHIEDIIKLCNNNIGNKYLTPNKNIKILVKNHKIYFLSQI